MVVVRQRWQQRCAGHALRAAMPGRPWPDAHHPTLPCQTNDDAITVTTMPVILDITSKHYNPNGCEVPATWFVSMNYTDYHLVQVRTGG